MTSFRIRDRYVVAVVTMTGLVILGLLGRYLAIYAPRSDTGWLTLGGISIAWAGLLTNFWLSRRQARAQATLDLLKTIRLDSDYLVFVRGLRDVLRNPRTVMTAEHLKIIGRGEGLTKSEADFRESVLFLLNFYDSISAAVYREDLDHDLIRRTIRGNIVRLVIQCSPFIRQTRSGKDKARMLENLVWFYSRFALPSDLASMEFGEPGPSGLLPVSLDLGPRTLR